jgi:hypothetical protein
MKEMTFITTCDGSDDCRNEVARESVQLAFAGKSVTVDLCAMHYEDFAITLDTALDRGVPVVEKKKRKSPTKKTVVMAAAKSAQTSVEPADVPKLDAPSSASSAVVDKSRICAFCGEMKRSNAGLAQHLRHKHSKTMAQHNTAEARKNKEQK